MTMLTNLRGIAAPGRGLIAVRAEAQPKSPPTIEALATAWEGFKAHHNQELADIKAGKTDVVTAEKTDRMNDAITALQASIDEQAVQIAAYKLNGGGGDQPRDPEYSGQFKAYFKRGDISAKLEEIRAAATKTDGEGGYLAPVEWDRTITKRLKQVSMMRNYASVISISGAGFKKVFSDRVVGSGWVGETAARPATTTPGLTVLDFGLGELYANPAASQGLIDDAEVDIEAWLADEVNTEFAKQEGIAHLSGDGVNKPFGVLTYVTGAANAAKHPWGAIPVVNSGAATALTADGILSLVYDLPAEFEANARLFINRSSVGALRKLKDAGNNYIWQPSFEAGQPSTIAGVPIADMPGMPVVAAGNVAALYGDMDATYQIVDRIGIRVLRDPFTNKPFVHFYTTKRTGGGVKNPEPMRALKVAA